jgi:hypothetical protein
MAMRVRCGACGEVYYAIFGEGHVCRGREGKVGKEDIVGLRSQTKDTTSAKKEGVMSLRDKDMTPVKKEEVMSLPDDGTERSGRGDKGWREQVDALEVEVKALKRRLAEANAKLEVAGKPEAVAEKSVAVAGKSVAVAGKSVAVAGKSNKVTTAKKRGRPKGDQPWVKQGISERTYYRQKAKD